MYNYLGKREKNTFEVLRKKMTMINASNIQSECWNSDKMVENPSITKNLTLYVPEMQPK